MRKLATLLIGSCVLALAGCGADLNAIGCGPWPVYAEPKAVEFTPMESEFVIQFKKDHPDVFEKIQAQDHAWRAIVREHNKRARELNKKKLEALGFKESDIQEVLKKE